MKARGHLRYAPLQLPQPQLRRERAVKPPRRQTGALGTAAPQPRSTSTGTELSTSPCRGQRGSKRDGGTLCEAGTARTSTQTGAPHAAQRPACGRAVAGGVWALWAMQSVPPRPEFNQFKLCCAIQYNTVQLYCIHTVQVHVHTVHAGTGTGS